VKRFLTIVLFVAIWLAISWKLRDHLLPAPRAERGPLPHITPPPAAPARPDVSVAPREQQREAPADEPAASTDPDDLQLLKGVGPVYEGRLADRGITTFDRLVAADSAAVAEDLGVPPDAVEDWKTQARSLRSG
jgi:predicted flap endonuclease-1-like 5' DNA nuclease